jgi:flagellar biosynthetic protein FliR
VQAGASLLDTLIGFSLGALVDPITNVQSSVLAQVYSMVAAVVFILSGGDHLVVMALARSYDLIPIDAVPSLPALAGLATAGLADIAVIGLEISAPVVIALLVTDAAFGVVSRVVPQMNVYFVGLPAKILVGLAVAGASLPFVAIQFENDLHTAIGRALQALAVG